MSDSGDFFMSRGSGCSDFNFFVVDCLNNSFGLMGLIFLMLNVMGSLFFF